MLKKIIKKLTSKHFWQRNIYMISIVATLLAIVAISVVFMVGGQQDVGAKQAGEQIVELAQNIRNQYKTRPDFWGLSTKEVIKRKIFSSGMVVVGNQLIGYFDNPVEIGNDEKGTPVMPTSRRFVVAYNGLNKQQCISLATLKFDPKFWLGVIAMDIKNENNMQTFDWSNKEFMLPAYKTEVKKICQNRNNTIVFHFE